MEKCSCAVCLQLLMDLPSLHMIVEWFDSCSTLGMCCALSALSRGHGAVTFSSNAPAGCLLQDVTWLSLGFLVQAFCAPCSGLGVHKVNRPSRGRHEDRTRSLIRFSGKFVVL